MRHGIAWGLTTALMVMPLVGCSGGGPYCEAVEKYESTLQTFGATKSDAEFAKYAAATTAIAKVSPEAAQKDWQTLADRTSAVIKAQKKTGLALEDMTKADKVENLSAAEIAAVNKAYEKWNDTADQRKAVVTSIDDECGITLTTSS